MNQHSVDNRFLVFSPSGYHKKRRESSGWVSQTPDEAWFPRPLLVPSFYLQTCIKTPTRLFIKAGPRIKLSFSEVPLYLAAQSNTTLILFGLRGLVTA